MNDKKNILAAIYLAIDAINKQLPVANRLAKDETAVIDSNALESLNLVNLLLSVEEQLQMECGIEVDLAATLSPTAEVPFRNVGQLADYVLKHASEV